MAEFIIEIGIIGHTLDTTSRNLDTATDCERRTQGTEADHPAALITSKAEAGWKMTVEYN